MARVGKSQVTLESIFFSSPEQKLIRLLLSEPATLFTPRVICSKLKGVRGLGGAEGVLSILQQFEKLGLVEFVSNQRAVRVQESNSTVQVLKTFVAICSFESLKEALRPVCNRVILFHGKTVSKGALEGDYDLLVVSATPDEVRKTAGRHPLGRSVELVVLNPDQHAELELKDPALFQKVVGGIVLWEANW